MPRTDTDPSEKISRRSELGNIALVTALLVMALSGVGVGLARFVQLRMEASAEMRLSNYAATLAQNVAESGVNQVLYNWNTGTVPAVSPSRLAPGSFAGIGTLEAFPSVVTTYPGYSSAVTTACSYTVEVADAGANWTITVIGTATTNGSLAPSLSWRTISRRVVATVLKGAPPFTVVGYSR